MVVKMMRWRPWPPLISRKYEVKLTVQRLEGGDWVDEGADEGNGGLAVEIRWKGPKISLGSFRRILKRNCTKEVIAKRNEDGQNGGVLVEWDEMFQDICSLSGYKENVFHPWEINFTVLRGLNQGVRNKIDIVGSAALNLAEYAFKIEEQVFEVRVPLTISGIAVGRRPFLCISLSLLELRAAQESTEVVQSPIMSLPSSSETSSTEKDEVSKLKAGLRKVKIFTEYVSSRRSKKTFREEVSEGKYSITSEDGAYAYPFDSISHDEFEEVESDQGKENSVVRKSFSYGSLAFANFSGYSIARTNNNRDDDFIYYSNRHKSDAGFFSFEDLGSTVNEQLVIRNSKRSVLLPWRKRKLGFRSSKAKGEPLLKKAYEEGGDDIDFDRRQLIADETLSFWWRKTDEDLSANRSSVSDFGDDNFAVGTWEQKEVTSRDGQMKIQTHVFFASIDQRSERAAGESACTSLVAVIADWFQNNQNLMPVKSQFDSLIRDGSLEWRNLCENKTYMQRFPDKHFDLDTILDSKVCDLCVVPEKSFIGFFHPNGMEEGNFDFLHGAMSFDNIWDEISHFESCSEGEDVGSVFIVSWNDHFFILKVEKDAYYIIDTLGERLHEGCDQAYILKFDKSSTIYKLRKNSLSLDEKPDGSEETMKNEEEEEIVCNGKETCKEYIKNFLAAIPIRELQEDMKKGLNISTLVHHRLQVEFHFTELQSVFSSIAEVAV